MTRLQTLGPIRVGCLAAAGLVLALPGAGAAPSLPEIPYPAIESLEPPDRALIESARTILDERLAAGERSSAALAESFGALGRLYLLHDQPQAGEIALANATRLAPERFEWWYFLGVLRQREGRLEAAEEAFSRAIDREPEDLAARVRIGQVELTAQQIDAAKESFEVALVLDEGCAAAWYGLGRIAAAGGASVVAIERFERALELQPTATAIHHPLGLAYRDVGDLDRARRHLAANRHEGVRVVDPLMDALNAELRGSRALLKAGNRAADQGRDDLALAYYRQAEVANPEDPLVVYNLAWLQARSGRRGAAIAGFERALELDPSYRDAHYNLATTLTEEGRLAAAAEHYEAAYRIDPLDHDARLDWAVSLARSERYEEARRELDAIVAELPGSEVETLGRARLARAQLAARVGDVEVAIGDYEAALTAGEGDAETRRRLAGLLGRVGRYEAAAEQFGVIVTAAPADVEAHVGRVMALLLSGDDAEALEAAGAGLEVAPGAVAIAHLLARILVASSDPAVRDGDEGLRLAGEVFRAAQNPDHAETLAMALAETGRFEDAVEWQGRVLVELEREGAAPARLEIVRHRLAGYARGEPVRSPWDGV